MPILRSGSYKEVKHGVHTAFEEVHDQRNDNESLYTYTGLHEFILDTSWNKDIYIFDNHNHAFYFWWLSLQKKHFDTGAILRHIDQHSDLAEPSHMPDHTQLDDQ